MFKITPGELESEFLNTPWNETHFVIEWESTYGQTQQLLKL